MNQWERGDFKCPDGHGSQVPVDVNRETGKTDEGALNYGQRCAALKGRERAVECKDRQANAERK